MQLEIVDRLVLEVNANFMRNNHVLRRIEDKKMLDRKQIAQRKNDDLGRWSRKLFRL